MSKNKLFDQVWAPEEQTQWGMSWVLYHTSGQAAHSTSPHRLQPSGMAVERRTQLVGTASLQSDSED